MTRSSAVAPMPSAPPPSATRGDEGTAPALGQSWALDRHVLPRIALAFISVASLSGVYLTMTTHGASPGMAVLRWVHLMSLGVLAGGAMWWGFFIRKPEDPEERDDVARFLLAQRARFQRIGRVALALALLSSVHLVTMAEWARGAEAEVWLRGGAALLLLTLSGAAALLFRPPAPRSAYSFAGVRAVCGGLVLSLALTAALDARLTFPGSGAALVLRPLHLVAFGLWVGGAVWNIFIAVPAAQRTLSIPVVANRLRHKAAVLRDIRPTDELIHVYEILAAEIADAVQQGRKNEWLDVETFRQLVGMEADTVRRHCNSGKIAPAKKVGGVWLIHRSAIEGGQTEAA